MSVRKIIGISGKFGSGKDTVAEMIIEMSNGRYQIQRFAHRLKCMVATLTNTSIEENFSREGKQLVPRGFNDSLGTLQQKLGMALREYIDVDVWVNSVLGCIGPDDYIVIPDVRFPNEYNQLHQHGGIVIRIEGDPLGLRTNLKSTDRDPNHPSECALDDFTFDYVIHNNGSLEELRQQVFTLFASLDTRLHSGS